MEFKEYFLGFTAEVVPHIFYRDLRRLSFPEVPHRDPFPLSPQDFLDLKSLWKHFKNHVAHLGASR